MTLVLAAQRWKHNGHLIAAVADMHILPRFPPRQQHARQNRSTLYVLQRVR